MENDMSVIDAIIKANKEGRKVEWPGAPKMATCQRCNENLPEEDMKFDGAMDLCEHCYDDLHTPWPPQSYIGDGLSMADILEITKIKGR